MIGNWEGMQVSKKWTLRDPFSDVSNQMRQCAVFRPQAASVSGSASALKLIILPGMVFGETMGPSFSQACEFSMVIGMN